MSRFQGLLVLMVMTIAEVVLMKKMVIMMHIWL